MTTQLILGQTIHIGNMGSRRNPQRPVQGTDLDAFAANETPGQRSSRVGSSAHKLIDRVQHSRELRNIAPAQSCTDRFTGKLWNRLMRDRGDLEVRAAKASSLSMITPLELFIGAVSLLMRPKDAVI